MSVTYYRHRWLVVCDDEASSYRTRQAARAACRRIAGHPANRDIRRFGPYNVTGLARVIDLGDRDECERQLRAAHALEAEFGDSAHAERALEALGVGRESEA